MSFVFHLRRATRYLLMFVPAFMALMVLFEALEGEPINWMENLLKTAIASSIYLLGMAASDWFMARRKSRN